SFGLLALSVLPASDWFWLLKQTRGAVLAGVGVGLAAYLLGQQTLLWWRSPSGWLTPLSDSTFWLVRFFLSFVSGEVICEPSAYVIGTAAYQVEVGVPCSGF